MSFCCCLPLFHPRAQAGVMGSLHAFPAVCHSSVCQYGGGYHCVLLTTSRAQYKHITAKGFPASMLPESWTMRFNPFTAPSIEKWPEVSETSQPSGVKSPHLSSLGHDISAHTHPQDFQSLQGQPQSKWLSGEHGASGPKQTSALGTLGPDIWSVHPEQWTKFIPARPSPQ